MSSIPDPCPAHSECTARVSVDIDGDGHPDRVGVWLDHCNNSGPYTECSQHVTVKTAAGKSSQIDESTDPNAICHDGQTTHDEGLLGTGNLDGRPGAEIVYIDCGGPHSRWGWILTWRNNRLERVRLAGHDYNFVVDAAITEDVGLSCVTRGNSHLLVEAGISPDGLNTVPPSGPSSYSGDQTTMRFDENGDLVVIAHRALHLLAAANGGSPDGFVTGFNCPGFKN